MIQVTPTLSIDESDLEESFIRASGPGGQNVNKLSSAVQLRFDAARCATLPEEVRTRLRRIAGRRMTGEGVVVITAQRFRSQERNRSDALERLLELLREAAAPPPPKRRPTRPTLASKKRRLESKRQRSDTKRTRAGVRHEE